MNPFDMALETETTHEFSAKMNGEEKKEPKEEVKVTYARAFDLDPVQTAPFIIFSNGHIARMMKTYIDLGTKYRFFLYPSESMSNALNIKGNEAQDKNYDRVEDLFIRDIPKEWAIILDTHPYFQRWFVFCDWNLNYSDPFTTRMGILINQIEILEAERNSALEGIKKIQIDLIRASRHGDIVKEEIIRGIAKNIKDLNISLLPPDKEGQKSG